MNKILFIILSLCSFKVMSQVTIAIPNMIPPSPNSQSFTKYGDYPVSNYTGLPDINIPIYTVGLKGVSIPISLSYNSSGIRVDEEASRVGLGWALNAGGVISHTIMGRYNDFTDRAYFNYLAGNKLNDLTGIYPVGIRKYTIGNYSSDLPFTCPGLSKYDFACGLYGDSPSCGGVELAPDVFNYSFMGYSGKFIFSHSGKIIKEKEDNLIIELTGKGQTPDMLTSWKITTPDGTKYYFNQVEVCVTNDSKKHNSSFYLTSIETPNGTMVNFSYTSRQKSVGIFNKLEGVTQNLLQNESISYAAYDIVVLDKISYTGGEVRFEYAYDRTDCTLEPRLKSVYITEDGSDRYRWDLIYDYFVSNITQNEFPTLPRLIAAIPSSSTIYNSNWNKYRLKLKEVRKVDLSYNIPLSYKFQYNEAELPTKLSMAKDHWGYYNGKNNATLIPFYIQNVSLDSTKTEIEYGGFNNTDRNAYDGPSQAFILKEITYPLGGKTTFSYESNRYLTNNFENDPHKKDFMHFISQSIIKTSPGERNAGSDWNKTTTLNVQGTQGVSYPVDINFNIWADLSCTNRANKVLNLEIIGANTTRYWNYIYSASQLPQGSSGSYNYSYQWKVNLPAGTYTVKASGDLISCIDTLSLNATAFLPPAEYIRTHPVGIGGGLRIKEINSFNTDGSRAFGKRFTYTNDGSISELQSSGKLMFYPRYKNKYNYLCSNGLRGGGFSVGYSKVYVSDIDNNGLEIGRSSFEYTNIPDLNLYYTWEDQSIANPASRMRVKDENPSGIGGYKFSENGTLLKEISYKKDLVTPLKETVYEYNMLGDGPYIIWGVLKSERVEFSNVKCIQSLDSDGLALISNQTPSDLAYGYLYPAIRPMQIFLSRKTETMYEGAKVLKRISSYQYNSKNQIAKEVLSSNSADLVTTKYTYPVDISNGIYPVMVSLNMLNYPIEQTSLRNNAVVSGKLTTYKANNGTYVQDRIYSLSSTSSLPSFSTYNGSIMDSHYDSVNPDVTFDQYDTKNNPLQLKGKGGTMISYLWDMTGMYPLAKVEGATYSQIESLSGKICSYNSTTLYNSIKSIVPNALITTYSYKPMVGMTSQTKSSGETIYFEYDNYGRLLFLKDKDGKIISSYKYNYMR